MGGRATERALEASNAQTSFRSGLVAENANYGKSDVQRERERLKAELDQDFTAIARLEEDSKAKGNVTAGGAADAQRKASLEAYSASLGRLNKQEKERVELQKQLAIDAQNAQVDQWYAEQIVPQRNYIKGLQDEIKLLGMTAQEAELYQAKLAGINGEYLQQAQALIAQREAASLAKSNKAEVDGALERMREEVALLGKSADEKERYRLAAKGADETQLNELKNGQEMLATHEKEQQEKKAGAERAKALVAANRTDLQQYQQDILEVQDLLRLGVISKGDATTALNAAKERYQGPTEDPNKNLPSVILRGSRESLLAERRSLDKHKIPQKQLDVLQQIAKSTSEMVAQAPIVVEEVGD